MHKLSKLEHDRLMCQNKCAENIHQWKHSCDSHVFYYWTCGCLGFTVIGLASLLVLILQYNIHSLVLLWVFLSLFLFLPLGFFLLVALILCCELILGSRFSCLVTCAEKFLTCGVWLCFPLRYCCVWTKMRKMPTCDPEVACEMDMLRIELTEINEEFNSTFPDNNLFDVWNELKYQGKLLQNKKREIQDVSELLQTRFPKELAFLIRDYYFW